MKNKVVWLVTFLILLLSFGLSIANYWSAFDQTRKQLAENSLPLSTDNIYTDVQKVILEPSLISSMMANDTFVKDWLMNDEDSTEKIVSYLDAVKNKYGFSNTFLVSTKTEKYYTDRGFLEVLSPDKADNNWYFRFKDKPIPYEINIDKNELIDNNLLLFFNYKIYANSGELLGIIGIVFKTSYISQMFHRFKEYYNLNVFLMDSQGNIKLSEQGINHGEALVAEKRVVGLFSRVMDKKSSVLEYEYDTREYLVKTKLIDELGLYLVVEAELSEFTGGLRSKLIMNLFVSLLVTSVIIVIVLRTISKYTSQLNKIAHHDTLTGLPNRRTFDISFEKVLQQYKRTKKGKSLIFFDIDGFKCINDTYGHSVGDKVLVRIAELMGTFIRSSDYVSRWGGDEFSVLLIDSDLENAEQVAEKLRAAIESDHVFKEIVPEDVTASFGVTDFAHGDTVKDIVDRSDAALYKAKQAGKNCVKSFVL